MRSIGVKVLTFGVLLAVRKQGDIMNKKHNIEPFEWSESGDTYTARFVYEESCNNVYAYGVYTRDGKKTTLTAIKNSLKRMEQRQRKERVI